VLVDTVISLFTCVPIGEAGVVISPFVCVPVCASVCKVTHKWVDRH